MDLLIVGFPDGTHIGASLARAAEKLGISYALVDASDAFAAPRVVRSLSWRLRGHRPPHLHRTSSAVAAACAESRPRWLLTTGMAPVHANALEAVRHMGVTCLNYLTDDPWNPRMRAGWFFDALLEYDEVFSPRRANLDDLRRHGCDRVSYLPFGYDAELCFHEEPATHQEWSRYTADLAFVGGADRDRVPYVDAMIRAGFDVALYGGYWNRFSETRRYARGLADVATIRKVTSASKVSLCLVRRANRDGHVMRSLEIPAMGGCLLAEDTAEHRALFGPPGEVATYFHGVADLLAQLSWLRSAESERRRLAAAAEESIHHGRHTYEDRLRTMLAHADSH